MPLRATIVANDQKPSSALAGLAPSLIHVERGLLLQTPAKTSADSNVHCIYRPFSSVSSLHSLRFTGPPFYPMLNI